MKDFRYLPGVVTLTYDEEACAGCGMCPAVCPHGVFRMNGRKAELIDRDGCIECGACALNCPSDAITVNPGVGCAAYIINSWLKRNKAGSCGETACC